MDNEIQYKREKYAKGKILIIKSYSLYFFIIISKQKINS